MWVLEFILITLITLGGCQKEQYFRVTPKNTRVQEGGEAVLECEVENLGGQVQWVKDGFAMGFENPIPGYPRFHFSTDRQHGVFNLRINNATLRDNGEYQCQAGPAHKVHKPIRTKALLAVIPNIRENATTEAPYENSAISTEDAPSDASYLKSNI